MGPLKTISGTKEWFSIQMLTNGQIDQYQIFTYFLN